MGEAETLAYGDTMGNSREPPVKLLIELPDNKAAPLPALYTDKRSVTSYVPARMATLTALQRPNDHCD